MDYESSLIARLARRYPSRLYLLSRKSYFLGSCFLIQNLPEVVCFVVKYRLFRRGRRCNGREATAGFQTRFAAATRSPIRDIRVIRGPSSAVEHARGICVLRIRS